MSRVLSAFPDGCEWLSETRGQHGYPAQVQLVSNSLVLGWLAFGAKHQRNWLYLTGAGLLHRRENGLTDESLADLCGIDGARLGRVDIALDIFDHTVFSVQQSIEAHAAGDYKLPRAPGNVHTELFQSSTNLPDFEVARTHYLGKRTATKRLRVYDKGLQILGSLTKEELAECQALGIVRAHEAPDDARIEEWTRVELIYKHDKRRPLNRDMIVHRDNYFAGAYPLLQKLLAEAEAVRPNYIPREEDCDHARLLLAHRESYGGHLYFLRHELGWSDEKIVRCLIGNKASARLMLEKEAEQ